MAVAPLQLDFEHSGVALIAGLHQISSFWLKQNLIFVQGLPENEATSHHAAEVWFGRSHASSGEEQMPPEHLLEISWQDFFSDPTYWWDKRVRKNTLRPPDFKPTRFKDARRVDSQAGGMRRHPESVFNSVPGLSVRFPLDEGDLEIEVCSKLCEDGHVTEAVEALDRLVQHGCHIPNNLFYRLLKRCTVQKNLVLGRRLHALTITSGYESDAFLANHLICMYASQGILVEAMQVFSKVSAPDAYMWASIILAYARHGQATEAVGLYRHMRESSVKPDNRIFVAALKACATAGDLAAGKDVHAQIIASATNPDMFVQNSLLDMYMKCGSLEDARRVFDRLLHRDVVTWTAMIAGYAQQGMGQEALSLYSRMQREDIPPPDSVTFVCLLQACASLGDGGLCHGKQLHSHIQGRGVQDDVAVGASLVNMYAKCGSLVDARRVFDRLSQKDVVTWTAMIAGYVEQGMGQQALSLYSSMQLEGVNLPNSVTYVCLLQACARMGEAGLHQGKQVHAQIQRQGLQAHLLVGNSLVNMYAKCGSLEDARRVFDELPQKDVVTWTALIAGYAQKEMGHEALCLYNSMQQAGMPPPNSVTFVCLLQACASGTALSLGKQLHAQIKERGLLCDAVLGTSLVDMYAKCGSLEDGQQVFDSLPEPEIVAWGALIAGYARRGESETVFALVDRMRMEGIEPNSITFLSVLAVCSHVGLVDKGRKYFEDMVTDYGITPTIEHYKCMMDLLGRAGHLDEVLQMVKTMPFEPDRAACLTLLGACRKWSNVEIGRQAFELGVSLDENDSAMYVVMSNIYEGAQMWKESEEIQARRKKIGAWKQPGQSWCTDMDGAVHSFAVGDGLMAKEYTARLHVLALRSKKGEYAP